MSVVIGWMCFTCGTTAPAAIKYELACPKCGKAMKRVGQ